MGTTGGGFNIMLIVAAVAVAATLLMLYAGWRRKKKKRAVLPLDDDDDWLVVVGKNVWNKSESSSDSSSEADVFAAAEKRLADAIAALANAQQTIKLAKLETGSGRSEDGVAEATNDVRDCQAEKDAAELALSMLQGDAYKEYEAAKGVIDSACMMLTDSDATEAALADDELMQVRARVPKKDLMLPNTSLLPFTCA